MEIVFTPKFNNKLSNILDSIAKDSPQRARKFQSDPITQIIKTTYMPYRFRKSKTADNDQIRDLIFKGYVVPFLIENKRIVVLSIFGKNLP